MTEPKKITLRSWGRSHSSPSEPLIGGPVVAADEDAATTVVGLEAEAKDDVEAATAEAMPTGQPTEIPAVDSLEKETPAERPPLPRRPRRARTRPSNGYFELKYDDDSGDSSQQQQPRQEGGGLVDDDEINDPSCGYDDAPVGGEGPKFLDDEPYVPPVRDTSSSGMSATAIIALAMVGLAIGILMALFV